MARITISGMEDKKPAGTTGTNTGANTGAGTSTEANTGTGTGSGNSGVAGGRLPWLGNMWNTYGNNSTNNSATETKANEERAETSIAELKNKYSQALRDEYNYSAEKLKDERDEALRENWILQQQAEASLPEQMAAAGINGGASETSLAALKARYQGDRNNIRGNYMDNLGDLSQQIQSERAQADRSLNERWIEYLLSLAENSYAARFK